jgi:TatD DNase family protein
MIIDTHCHYNLSPLAENWKDHWQEAQAKGVTKSIVVGTSVETSQLAVTIAQQEENLFATVGLHPNYWQKIDQDQTITEVFTTNELAAVEALVTQNKVIAIGETGLDYFRLDKQTPTFKQLRQQQLSSLQLHLEIATKHDLPIILHVRDNEVPENPQPNNAYWDTLELLEKHLQTNTLTMIMHCFSGPAAYIEKMITLGAYVGVAGNITYGSSYPLRAFLRNAPQERILLETDAPYLPPQSHRGKQCLPWMIAETADFLENKIKISKQTILQNTWRLFPQMRYND